MATGVSLAGLAGLVRRCLRCGRLHAPPAAEPPADPTRGVVVGAVDDFAIGVPHVVHIGDVAVLIVRRSRSFVATVNACPHLGRDLADARVSGSKLICAGHLQAWDLNTGRRASRNCGPSNLTLLPVAVCDGQVVVDVTAGWYRAGRQAASA